MVDDAKQYKWNTVDIRSNMLYSVDYIKSGFEELWDLYSTYQDNTYGTKWMQYFDSNHDTLIEVFVSCKI